MSHRLTSLMILMFSLTVANLSNSYQVYHVLFVLDLCLTSQLDTLLNHYDYEINMTVYCTILIYEGMFIYSFKKGCFRFTNISWAIPV